MADTTATPTSTHDAGRRHRLLRAAAVAAGVALPVAALAVVVRSEAGPVVAFDRATVLAATEITRENPTLYQALLVWQAAFAPGWVILVVGLVCLWAWRRHGLRTRALWAFVTVLVAWCLGNATKYLVQRPRPVVEDPLAIAPGFSFPSSHALNTASAGVILMGLLWPLLDKRGRGILFGLVSTVVVLTGLDRVMLGVHYPSDVIAGIALGGGFAAASFLAFVGWDPPVLDAVPRTQRGARRPTRSTITAFVRRYELDTSQPTLRQARSDLARRTLAPAAVLLAAITGVGLIIVGPLDSLPGENVVNEDLAASRTPTLTTLTAVWSTIGQTEFIAVGCLVALALVWWRTRQWWLAVVPSIAVAVQATVFITSAFIVGRERPDVEALDVAPPTSGFPSGHTGASTAFYLTLALLAHRIRRPVLRWAVTVACLLVPLLVAYSRLYRGLHHPSDVAFGALNGLVCAVLAWRYLRRDTTPRTTPTWWPETAATLLTTSATDSAAGSAVDSAVGSAVDSAVSDPAVSRPAEGVHPVGREPERDQGQQDRAKGQGRDGP